MKRSLGVCYYPEHWDKSLWKHDAARMAQAGLEWVRLGEFAWSRIEPERGRLVWDWLDEAIDILGNRGLKVVLGTPTATPPRWMIDRYPEMVAVDEAGKPRKFGSRRHYCFSHAAYRREAARISGLMAERYGHNAHVHAWQIDNEYGCHETILSYSDMATRAFRDWLEVRYGSIDALNQAWGNVFWSMEYGRFDQVDLPSQTVTEPNPSHLLAFRRFSSDQVAEFNKAQVEAIRPHSDAPLIHNYMGRITEFDHFKVGQDLDIASWDSYPIGFLSDRLEEAEEHKVHFLRQGDPDFQAFHHDLYRGVGKGRWWVMEQQPGPVNWAPYNPAPLSGMVRLWSWEAFAHGAEAVCYFRWRQAPFAQEQMHSGLLRPDNVDAQGMVEAEQVREEIAEDDVLAECAVKPAKVALLFDYASQWAWEAQPQGADFDYFRLMFETYRALRSLGLSIDILPVDASLEGYGLVMAPGLLCLDQVRLKSCNGQVVLGPRSGVKSDELTMLLPLGPNVNGLDCKVILTQSLPPSEHLQLSCGGGAYRWLESLEGEATSRVQTGNGMTVLMGDDRVSYLATWPDLEGWQALLTPLCEANGIKTQLMPRGVRVRESLHHRFVFNYNPDPIEWDGLTLAAAGVHWDKLA